MNTTHSTSELSFLDAGPYTSIGNTAINKTQSPSFSIIIMESHAHPSASSENYIKHLLSVHPREIIYLQKELQPKDSIEIRKLCHEINNLRFLIFSEKSTWGARINTAIRECTTPYQFVISRNMQIQNFNPQIINTDNFSERICTVPCFKDEMDDLLPTVFGPIIAHNSKFETRLQHPCPEENDTLVPWEYTAIYNKDKHMALGGFDAEIMQPWWQKLEYGLRAWLWGEKLKSHHSILLKYIESFSLENHSPDADYSRLFYKTLAIRYKKNQGQFPGLLRRILTDMNSLPINRIQIRKLRSWIRQNRHRYTQDALSLAKHWNWN